jgi:intein/homing endonuclease
LKKRTRKTAKLSLLVFDAKAYYAVSLNILFFFNSKAFRKQKLWRLMKMKFNNYLLKLDRKEYSRKGSDNIRVYGVGKHVEQIYSDLKQFRDIKDIEKDFTSHQVFSSWILNKNGIAIQELYALHSYWKYICNKSDEELQELWDKCYDLAKHFGCMNGKKILLPKELDYQLAYLLGVICGDGHLAEPNHSYDKLTSYNSELRITDQNQDTFVFLTKLFEGLFRYTPKIYSEKSKVDKSFYRLVIRSKPMHRFLMVVCGLPVGDKRGKTKVPEIIKNSPLELKKWFIAGFFDADGCILTKNKWPAITITQYNSKILEEIKEISLKLGINWKGPYSYHYEYNNCTIKIYCREDVQRFLNTIPSLNPLKIKQRKILWEKLKMIT